MTSSYIGGQFSPTILDCQVLNSLNDHSKLSEFPHISRWVSHIQSFNKIERSNFDQAPVLQINQPQDLKSRVRRRCMWLFKNYFLSDFALEWSFYLKCLDLSLAAPKIRKVLISRFLKSVLK